MGSLGAPLIFNRQHIAVNPNDPLCVIGLESSGSESCFRFDSPLAMIVGGNINYGLQILRD